ncbi:MAG: hypothetical protein ACYDD4_04295 [Acidimicrobiales bacterium]
MVIASSAAARCLGEVGERHVASGQQPRIGRAELDHPAVVGARHAVGELEVAAVFPVVKAAVVESVEHELAGEAEEIQCPPTLLGDEGSGGGEVLAGHDLRLLVAPVLLAQVRGAQSVEGGDEIALLVLDLTGLAQLVSTGVAKRCDALTDTGIGVVRQPRRGLHDVGVRVVDDPRFVVRHRSPPALANAATDACTTCMSSSTVVTERPTPHRWRTPPHRAPPFERFSQAGPGARWRPWPG